MMEGKMKYKSLILDTCDIFIKKLSLIQLTVMYVDMCIILEIHKS